MAIALFPGQGVQAPGMDGGLAGAAPEIFAVATSTLGVDVIQLCRDGRSGPADLESTRWTQPAVLTCGVAACEVLTGAGEEFAAATGHSAGEYAALVVAGVLDFAEALRLVSIRGQAMEEAARLAPGGMAAIMRVDASVVERICEDCGVALAAENGPGQYVISGPLDSLEAAVEAATGAGGKSRRLDIAGAFHSPAMASAAERVADALQDATLGPSRIRVWSSTTAREVSEPDEIRQALVDQLTCPVRWRETVEDVAAHCGKSFLDAGPGRVVGGLVRRIVDEAEIRYAADLVPEHV